MKLIRLTQAEKDAAFEKIPTEFGAPSSVQGGTVRKAGNVLLVNGRRHKLFTAGRDYILIREGDGFIKWARGETAFACGDAFLLDGVGEYEINGAHEFIAVRESKS